MAVSLEVRPRGRHWKGVAHGKIVADIETIPDVRAARAFMDLLLCDCAVWRTLLVVSSRITYDWNSLREMSLAWKVQAQPFGGLCGICCPHAFALLDSSLDELPYSLCAAGRAGIRAVGCVCEHRADAPSEQTRAR